MPSLIPGSLSCSADIYLPCWSRGKPATLDISVISLEQMLMVEEAAVSYPGVNIEVTTMLVMKQGSISFP